MEVREVGGDREGLEVWEANTGGGGTTVTGSDAEMFFATERMERKLRTKRRSKGAGSRFSLTTRISIGPFWLSEHHSDRKQLSPE